MHQLSTSAFSIVNSDSHHAWLRIIYTLLFLSEVGAGKNAAAGDVFVSRWLGVPVAVPTELGRGWHQAGGFWRSALLLLRQLGMDPGIKFLGRQDTSGKMIPEKPKKWNTPKEPGPEEHVDFVGNNSDNPRFWMWLQNLVGAWIVGTAEILLIFGIIWATLKSGCFWSERCLCTFPSQHEHFYIKLFSHIVLGRLHHFLSDSNSAAVSERNWFDLAIVVSAVFEVLVLWQSDAISVMLVRGRGRLKTQFRSGCVVFFLNNRWSMVKPVQKFHVGFWGRMYLGTRMMVEMLSALKGDLCLVWTIKANAIAAIDASRLGPVFGWKWLIATYIYMVMGLF